MDDEVMHHNVPRLPRVGDLCENCKQDEQNLAVASVPPETFQPLEKQRKYRPFF
jgi:hypothetical protein